MSELDQLFADRFDNHYSVYYKKKSGSLLNALCDKYGSDKGESTKFGHPYPWPSHTYADLLERMFDHCRAEVRSVFECGIGTNNPDIQSSMGVDGRPGASLRVWRDYFPNAQVVGADIDSDILFQEERISTYSCDQTDPDSIRQMWQQVPVDEFDLMVDDGLHTFEAGACLLSNSFHKLRIGGIYVIEDVPIPSLLDYDEFLAPRGVNYEFVNLFRKDAELNDNSLVILRK